MLKVWKRCYTQEVWAMRFVGISYDIYMPRQISFVRVHRAMIIRDQRSYIPWSLVFNATDCAIVNLIGIKIFLHDDECIGSRKVGLGTEPPHWRHIATWLSILGRPVGWFESMALDMIGQSYRQIKCGISKYTSHISKTMVYLSSSIYFHAMWTNPRVATWMPNNNAAWDSNDQTQLFSIFVMSFTNSITKNVSI